MKGECKDGNELLLRPLLLLLLMYPSDPQSLGRRSWLLFFASSASSSCAVLHWRLWFSSFTGKWARRIRRLFCRLVPPDGRHHGSNLAMATCRLPIDTCSNRYGHGHRRTAWPLLGLCLASAWRSAAATLRTASLRLLSSILQRSGHDRIGPLNR